MLPRLNAWAAPDPRKRAAAARAPSAGKTFWNSSYENAYDHNRHHTQVRTLSHKSTIGRGWWMLKHVWDAWDVWCSTALGTSGLRPMALNPDVVYMAIDTWQRQRYTNVPFTQ
jgi:hypothetical protein